MRKSKAIVAGGLTLGVILGVAGTYVVNQLLQAREESSLTVSVTSSKATGTDTQRERGVVARDVNEVAVTREVNDRFQPVLVRYSPFTDGWTTEVWSRAQSGFAQPPREVVGFGGCFPESISGIRLEGETEGDGKDAKQDQIVFRRLAGEALLHAWAWLSNEQPEVAEKIWYVHIGDGDHK